MKITDLSNMQLRHQLRGAMSNLDDRPRNNTIGHARRLLTPDDIPTFSRIFCNTDLDEFYFGPPFPNSVKTIYRTNRRQQIELELECQIQVERMHFYMNRAMSAAKSIGDINNKILAGDLINAHTLCEVFCTDFGYSAAIGRKVVYLHLIASENLGQERETFQQTMSGPLLGRFFDAHMSPMYSQYISLVLDICDPDTDCMQVRFDHLRILRDSNSKGESPPPHDNMMRRTLYPTFYHSIINPIGLLYFSSSSAIDLLLDFVVASYTNTRRSCALMKLFSEPEFIEARRRLQPNRGMLDTFVGALCSDAVDESVYRASYIFSEIRQFARWRRSVDFELSFREQGGVPDEPRVLGYFPKNLQLPDLCEAPSSQLRSLVRFEPGYADTFLRTIAVLNRLRHGERLSDLEASNVKKLLSNTSGFARILSEAELLGLKDAAWKEESYIVVFLAMVMLDQKSPNEDLAFELRMTFQQLVRDSFDSDILNFLNWLNQRTPNLCPVIIELCDISFLEKLYLMHTSYSEVLDVRERLCRWAAKCFNRSEYETVANRLALDSKVRRIRGEIDETRIFVDVIRYQQWAQDTIVPILRKYERIITVSLSTDNEISTSSNVPLSKKGAPVISGDYWFSYACDVAFKEFCHNNIFGIDSYLSRRVRHGTLAGTLLVPIQQKVLSFKNIYEHTLSDSDIEALETLVNEYKRNVDRIRDDLLHFRSDEKPDGLLFPAAVRNAPRRKMEMDFREQMLGYLRDGYTTTDLSPSFLDYCWNLLTGDLLRVQAELKNFFTKSIRPKLRKIAGGRRGTSEWKQLANELDQTAEGLMNSLSRWFSKSDGPSMTVTVRELVSVVVDEVGNYRPNYGRRFIMSEGGEESLFGLTYQTVYDILFILFSNIAQHADAKAETIIESKFVAGCGKQHSGFMMKITSKNCTGVSDAEVRQSINEALSWDNDHELMMREGRSGLAKARTIMRASSSDSSFEWFVDDGKCCVSFMMPIILVGTE